MDVPWGEPNVRVGGLRNSYRSAPRTACAAQHIQHIKMRGLGALAVSG